MVSNVFASVQPMTIMFDVEVFYGNILIPILYEYISVEVCQSQLCH
jgi:hypothetical protein